ncbi:ParB/Srx family N-terminal domain-containing protein [uncultured Dysosmobacter sp.]|uniref:ParB/Srx family N-terminal domain-containing protein n=1 Tax=uncultured Dysosmobacter sp. TaxID=2591384 RepID=UPI0026124A98|nr:ParB N-terminal domain-containing protein [uncultured Dysosmobacter sp.]
MKIIKKPLADLRRPPKNVRIHSDKQITEFKRSIEMFGQIRPIVIDEAGTILAGNGLYDALCAMGRTEADCYVAAGLSESQKKKLMLADNRIFSLGVDDIQGFDEIIAELDDLDVPGYDEDLLKTLTADLGDTDELLAGYGLIDENSKAEMKKAADRYEQKSEEFAQDAEEIRPAPPPSEPVEAAVEDRAVELDRRYIICPKCGEKIWL